MLYVNFGIKAIAKAKRGEKIDKHTLKAIAKQQHFSSISKSILYILFFFHPHSFSMFIITLKRREKIHTTILTFFFVFISFSLFYFFLPKRILFFFFSAFQVHFQKCALSSNSFNQKSWKTCRWFFKGRLTLPFKKEFQISNSRALWTKCKLTSAWDFLAKSCLDDRLIVREKEKHESSCAKNMKKVISSMFRSITFESALKKVIE